MFLKQTTITALDDDESISIWLYNHSSVIIFTENWPHNAHFTMKNNTCNMPIMVAKALTTPMGSHQKWSSWSNFEAKNGFLGELVFRGAPTSFSLSWKNLTQRTPFLKNREVSLNNLFFQDLLVFKYQLKIPNAKLISSQTSHM